MVYYKMTANHGGVNPSRMYSYMYDESLPYQKVYHSATHGIGTLSQSIVMNGHLTKFYQILIKAGLAHSLGMHGNVPKTMFVPSNETIKNLDVDSMSRYDAYQFIMDRTIKRKVKLLETPAYQLLYSSMGEFPKQIKVIRGENAMFYNLNKLLAIDVETENAVYNIY